MDFWAKIQDGPKKRKCTKTFKGELNVTVSQLGNINVQLFNVSVV